MLRFLRNVLLLVLGSFVLAVGLYTSTDRFSQRWRGFVTGELAKHGVFIDFDRLVISPLGGLVAEEVRVFNDSAKRTQLASLSHLNLDINLSLLLEGQVEVESLELSHANVSLPVDPALPDLTVIELQDLNARAYLHGNTIDIRQAQGVLSGIRLDIRGTLVLPNPREKPDEDNRSALERLQLIRAHRAQVQNVLDWLGRFQSAQPPLVSLEVNGDLNQPQEIKAELSLHAEALHFENYTWDAFNVEASYDGGMIDIRRIHLTDHLGQIEATATWRIGTDRARFRMTSSADIPALARTFFEVGELNEAVFYEPPDLALEGYWFPGINKGKVDAERVFPAEVTGHVECKRFGSRGAIFEGLSANIGVNAKGFYIRDAVLRHKTGTVEMQVMQHREQGVKYDATLRMDPNYLTPFIIREKTREIVRRFEFDEKSYINVRVAGEGPSFRLQDGVNSGHGVLKHFRYNGVLLEEMESDIAFSGFFQNFRNVRIQHPKGPASAADIFLNDEEKWVRLTDVRAACDTPDIMRCFTPPVAERVAQYRLSIGTDVTVNGTIGIREPKYNDYTVTFKKPGGEGHYELWDEDYTIRSPDGEVRVKDSLLSFDVKGSLFQRDFRAVGQTELGAGVSAWNVDVNAGTFPYEVFSKTLDFTGMRASVRNRGTDLTFDVKATVLGGGMTLKGSLDQSRTPNPYAGELRIDAMDFAKFAQTYSKNDDTSKGDLSGDFKFTGRMNDWGALKGGGSLIIVNGNLMSLPILGPLTPLIGALLPRPIAGYNIAKEADCTFDVSDGYFRTRNLEALTSSFRITSRGDVNFIRDDIDFDAEVRVRGLLGIPLLLVSELFAFHGTGTIADSKWAPKILSGRGSKPAPVIPKALPETPETPKKRNFFQRLLPGKN